MSVRDFILQAPPQQVWPALISLMVAAGTGFFLFLHWLHRARLIADTPTATIRAAAQGYVELEGIARMMDGEPIHAPLSGERCVWYRYTVEHKSDDDEGWRTVESAESEAIFHLDDGTGRCIVDPEGATIVPSVRLRWRGQLRHPVGAPLSTGFWDRLLASGPYRYTECRIGEGDPIYATGQFVAVGSADTLSPNDEVRDLLSRWKRNRPELLKRFDADGDGDISLAEWETVRIQAEREVMASWHERAQASELSLLRRPGYGRPFLLSSMPQRVLASRYRRHALLAVATFLVLGSGAAWALGLRLGADL